MLRIRTIKPEFWTSEQVADCSRDARLLLIGIWNFADDSGVHPYSPKRLKMEIFPGNNIEDSEVASMVDELVRVGLLSKYEAQGGEFLHVTGFAKHQLMKKSQHAVSVPASWERTSTRSATE